ncbi:DNA polymerase III subunit alpha [Candidatus Nomurabacteria bacterium]|nr:DNA polymerase III subunit alpha [Candidatus Nomurabacteria bacterium]
MFVHLHTHSHYSLLDGLATIDHLVNAAKDKGMSALALTDHGVMSGAIEFYQKAKKAGIKPIIGVEAYLAPDELANKNPKEKPYHLILLAENNEGYKNLLKLTSIAHLEGFYYKPRIDWETLKKYSQGIIASTACLNGPLARHLKAGQHLQAEKNLEKLLEIFGKDNLFLEMQYLNNPDQQLVNIELKKLAAKHDLKLIATNDIHYINSDDDQAQDILLCIQTKHKQSDTDRMSYLGENFSMLSENEMQELFPEDKKALENTQIIADRCNVEIELGVIQLPHYELPENISADQQLKNICLEGVKKRFGFAADEIPPEIKERLDYELEVIEKTGYAAYFLIVQDFVNWSKNQKIIVGPGRGSAAGSLVAYLTNITNIDPLKYELLFERFLNPERVSMPDIDLDFADARRDEVLRYVESRYGHDHVSQIITFGTMAARAAVRDVGRVLNFSYGYCDQIAKMIPMFTTLGEALETVAELKKLYEDDPEAQRLLEMSKKVEGLARHSSVHACGVLITKNPLTDHVPLQYAAGDDKTIISQYSLHPVEDLGLLKMDFLGLKNLTVLEQTLKIIEKTKNIKLDLENFPLDDEKTFKLLQKGETTGVFQLESGGMKRYLKNLKPTDLEDIIAMVALYRPGPMEFIPDFIASKHGEKKVEYLHPSLEPILKNTYGIAIYQEQIMNIARELAGFSYGQADVLRKAVGKKIKELLDQQEEAIIKGMIANGIEKNTAKKIWEFIIPFARYGFNRAHAACYAAIAYQTAYLKANFPAAFMAALLTADQNNIDRVTIEINECRKMGIAVLQPDINQSFSTFAVINDGQDNKITFGLNAIKNVGHHISEIIVEERKANGEFKSLEDFLNRIKDKDLNRKSLESLIKCGAFDKFLSRGQALGNLEKMLEFNKKIQNEAKSGQSNLFADLPLASTVFSLKLDHYPEISSKQTLSWEKELLGLYLSDHPFKEYLYLLKNSITKLKDIKRHAEQTVKVSGIITNIQKIITQKGKAMLFVTIEDSTNSVEVLVFPKTLESTLHVWQDENLVTITGKISDKDGQAKILVENANILSEETIKELNKKHLSQHQLWLDLPAGFDKDKMQEFKKIFDNFPGETPVYLKINNGKIRKIKTDIKVLPDEKLKTEVTEFLENPNAWTLLE